MDQEKKNPNEAANDADDTAKKQDVTAQAADTPAAPADDKEEKDETEPAGDADLEEKKKSAKKRIRKLEHEVEELQKQVTEAQAQTAAQKDQYIRLYAEFDNYRKRTAKERDGIYTDAFADALKTLLPIIDNLERANANSSDPQKLAEGLAIVLRSAQDALKKMGITEIACDTFDPNLPNAVFHVEDDRYGEGQILEVLQKGYMRGDRVIRYAMVKVAN